MRDAGARGCGDGFSVAPHRLPSRWQRFRLPAHDRQSCRHCRSTISFSALLPVVGWGCDLFSVLRLRDDARELTRGERTLPTSESGTAGRADGDCYTRRFGASAWVMRPVMYGAGPTNGARLDARHVASVTSRRMVLREGGDNGNEFHLCAKDTCRVRLCAAHRPLVREYLSEPCLLDAAVGADRLSFSALPPEVDRNSACLADFAGRSARIGSLPLVIHRRDAMEAAGGDRRPVCRQGWRSSRRR